MKGKKKPGMDVPLLMKIRISLSLVMTLGVAYIALACEEGGERWKLLPDPQSPIWVGTLMALIVAGLGLLVWERALNARFAAVAVLTLGIFYIAFALDGGFGLPALPRGENRRSPASPCSSGKNGKSRPLWTRSRQTPISSPAAPRPSAPARAGSSNAATSTLCAVTFSMACAPPVGVPSSWRAKSSGSAGRTAARSRQRPQERCR